MKLFSQQLQLKMDCNCTDILSDPQFGQTDLPEMKTLEPIISFKTRQDIIIFNYCILGHVVGTGGIVTNIINIVTFLKMGFSETINISLLGLAVSDLFCLITIEWLFICYTPFLEHPSIPFAPTEIQYVTGGFPHVGFTRVTGIITAYIAFERCLCVILPLKVKRILTPTSTLVVILATFPLMFSIVVPIFFVYRIGWKYYSSQNRSRFGLVGGEDTAHVESVVLAVNTMATFITFGLVLIFTFILIFKLKSKAKWREEVTAVKSDEKTNQKSSLKERRAVAMVTAISVIFIICFTPATLVCIGMIVVPEFRPAYIGGYENLNRAAMSFGFLLESVNSSINIFVYVKMSSKYRTALYQLLGKTA